MKNIGSMIGINIFLALCFIHFGEITGQAVNDNSLVLRTDVDSLTLKEGDNITISCTLDSTKTGGGEVMNWFRIHGVIKELMGSRMYRNIEFGNPRYEFDLVENSATSATYKLYIKSLRLSDSATIECSSLSSRRATWPLIVCVEPQSESCRCSREMGWHSPDCFQSYLHTRDRHTEYRSAVIALSVALAVLFILSTILTVYVVRDCTARIRYSRDREANEPLTPRARAQPVDPATAPVSALKQRGGFGGEEGMVSNGVRFVDTPKVVTEGAYPPVHIERQPSGVLMSPTHLEAPKSVYTPTPTPGTQSPNRVPYGSVLNLYQSDGLQHGAIYSSAVNLNYPSISYGYNQQGESYAYNQVQNSRPAEFPESRITFTPPNPQMLHGYSDQLVANNLNSSLVLDDTHRASQILYSSHASLNAGSTIYMDPNSTSV